MTFVDVPRQEFWRTLYQLTVGILIGLIIGGFIWLIGRSPRGQAVELLPAPTAAPLIVDVTGAVLRPGVYELPHGSRVKDAIEAAGGLLAEADRSNLNLAAPLDDGQRLDIPFLLGMEPTPAIPRAGGSESGGQPNEPTAKININTATLEELITLPGIGPTLAQRIIDYRNTYGEFYFIEDIINVPGIGPKTFEQIQDLIMTGYEDEGFEE